MNELTGLKSILDWLTGIEGGAFLVVAAAAAWAFEGWGAWSKLKSKVRSLIILGAAIALGLGSWALGKNPEIVAAIEEPFRVVMYVVVAWIATQGAHWVDPKRTENAAREMMRPPVG